MVFNCVLVLCSGLPVSVSVVLTITAQLFINGEAATTSIDRGLVSTISTEADFHKLNGHVDPPSCFVVSKLSAGSACPRNFFPYQCSGHGPFSTAYFGGFGLWVRVEVLVSDCNNSFPNTNHNLNHNSNDYLTLTPKSNPELTLTLTLY